MAEHALDVVVHEPAEAAATHSTTRFHLMDPAWHPWHDDGYPPLGPLAPGRDPTTVDYRRGVTSHSSFDLARSAALDGGRLRQAYLSLLHRHESLRLVFPEPTAPGPSPAALREVDNSGFQVLDAEADDPDMGVRTAQGLVADTAAVPFDLAHGPFARLLCIRITPTLHLVGWVIDHIILDGESCQILAEDLAIPQSKSACRPGSWYAGTRSSRTCTVRWQSPSATIG